ncbi:DUF4340 domain-containing protein [Mucisphaera calidilacus]|uniref:DUF4340 domain-containing protein n=1 Tax=Mucisphaera calidilacus TaxID=2527982 RepID=A0A518BV62_9BACT|nr:DUF4340 domain-containing protein [Mucisphaera calidilacus]QDU70859.1 hypothetical protein Pan265_06990 [Mucisphaera calidilacus]
MNLKTTLFLLVMVAGVAGYVFFFELKNETTEQREQREAQSLRLEGSPLIDADDRPEPADVTRLELVIDGNTTVIERQGDGWQQTQPVTFPMQTFAVDRVCRELFELRLFERLDPGNDGAPTHEVARLAEPRALLRLHTADTTYQAALGRRLPGDQAYLQLNDHDDILVVDDDLHLAILDEGVNNWRATTLAAPTLAQTESLQIIPADSEPITLHNLGERWSLDEAGIQRADQDAVRDAVAALSRLRIEDFKADRPEDLARYGLDRPDLIVTSHRTAEDDTQPLPPLTLFVGGAADMETTQRFAAITRGDQPIDVVFTLRESDLTSLRPAVDDLRDKQVLAVEPADINAIRVQNRNTAFGLLRGADGVYRFGAPDPGYRVDRIVATDTTQQLARLEALGFATLDRVKAEIGSLEVSITGEEQPLRIRVCEPTVTEEDSEPRWLLIREPEPFGYLVDPAQLEALLAGPLAFKDRTLLALEREQITQIEMRLPGRVLIDLLSGEQQGTWTVNDEPADTQRINPLIDTLAGLRAAHWLTKDEQPTPRLTGDLSTLTVWAGQENQHAARLLIDAPTNAGTFEGDDAWFTLDPDTTAALLSEQRPADLIVVSPSDIRTITLSLADTTLNLERDPRGGITIDGTEPDDPAPAVRLIDLLSQLRAERLLAETWTPEPDAGLRVTITLADNSTHELQLTGIAPEGFLLPRNERSVIAVVNNKTVLIDGETFETAVGLMTNPQTITP